MRKIIAFSTVTLSCFSSLTLAEMTTDTTWSQCNLPSTTEFVEIKELPPPGMVDVKADHAQLVNEGTSVFSGNVIVKKDGQELTADRATYNRTTGTVTASDNMRMSDTDIVLKADKAEWSVNRDEGRLLDAEYRLKDMHARGEASHVYREGRARTDLKNATYTTCPSGDNFWDLKASEVSLDHEEAVGEAEDVVITIKDIPVFYTPYISFPLNDERKSGFLVPSVGNSDETGFDVRTPYYWNIAPNRDATITPRYMSERGLLLNGEYRYLYESGQGEIDAGFLNSDKLKNDGEDINPHYDEDRKHFSLKHESTFDSPWQTDIDYNYVSDDDYLEDFGSSLSLASTTHLNRDLIVGYHEDYWDFTGRFQGYQTITDATEPYKRLPQLLFQSSLSDQLFGLTYDMRAEYVDFDHDDLVTGQRYDIEPAISLPMQTAATFFTPRLAVKHTRYDLEDNIVGNIDQTPTRTLPIASVDTGVFFERELSFADTAYIQTLEPRAFYLYIPGRNQDDIPDFDASLRTFNTSQLFSHNRYSGTDRIGDANQLTLALTTRFINDETGQENFSASLGQIQYFSDRDVTLPGNSRQTRSNSDMIAEVAAKLSSSWSARGQLQWDTYDNISNMSSAQLRYRGENGGLLNISHRYRRDGVFRPEGLEQLDISGRWPVTRQWNIVGRYYRSIREQRVLEGLFGVEYDDCCWAYRLVVRNYINDADDDDRNLAIMLEVELKGLGNFGQKAETILQRSILGYGDDE